MRKKPLIISLLVLGLLAGFFVRLYFWQKQVKMDTDISEGSIKGDELQLGLLLDAFQVPTATQPSAVYALLHDDVSLRLSLRMKIPRKQLDDLIQRCWMQTHGTPVSELRAYQLTIPEFYNAKLWDMVPFQDGDKAFYLKLEGFDAGRIAAIVRTTESEANVYLVRDSRDKDFDSRIVSMFRQGKRLSDPGAFIPSQMRIFQIGQGKF